MAAANHMNGVLNSKRDPRAEKQRDWRRQGHCHRARCGICHPHKRFREYKAERMHRRVELRALRV